jgi:hypothetical protein
MIGYSRCPLVIMNDTYRVPSGATATYGSQPPWESGSATGCVCAAGAVIPGAWLAPRLATATLTIASPTAIAADRAIIRARR